MYLLHIVLFLLFVSATAAFGELDSSFGIDGRTSIEIGTHGDRAQAIAIQADGKILLGGSSADSSSLAYSLIRLLPDGSPDSSFNGDGKVVLDSSRGDDEILALALTEDGHILAAGYTSSGRDRDFSLLRFNSDGSLDTGFGNQGKVITSVGNSNDEITAMAVDKDGAFLVAGSAEGTLGRIIVLGRYLADGHLDPTFSDQGLSLIGIGLDVVAQGMIIREDGSAVISGSYTDGETVRMVLVGFTSEGLIDAGFGEQGVAVTEYNRQISEGYGLFRNQDGELFVAGSVGPEGKRSASIFRFTDQGVPETSFGEVGALVAEVGSEDDVFYSLAGNATSLHASGFTSTSDNRDFLFVSYEQGGDEQTASSAADEMDGTVPRAEVITTSFISGDSMSYALAVQQDGKVVTVGTSGDSENSSMAVSRYTVAGSVTPTVKSVPSDVNVYTLPPTDIDATGANTGGNIFNGLTGSVTQRGVVYSIAPYPTCGKDCADGVIDDGGGTDPTPGEDTTSPVITSETDPSFTNGSEVILSVLTDESATCKYNEETDVEYGSMSNSFFGANTTKHTRLLDPLPDATYTYYVRCTDAAGNVNSTGKAVSFTVAPATTENTIHQAKAVLAAASVTCGDFFVASAHAVDTTDASSTSSSTSTSLLSGKSLVNEEGYTIDGSGHGIYSTILNELTPDTRYYLRAYAITESPSGTKTIHYGQIIEFETPNACFIATAAYGSILHPAVGVLREFRDNFLKTNHWGRQFVYWYYKNSPPLADKIAASTAARYLTRVLLVPVITASWLLLHPQAVVFYCCIVCLIAMALRMRNRYLFD
jgi:uncharacterized delta-60 repeat protein